MPRSGSMRIVGSEDGENSHPPLANGIAPHRRKPPQPAMVSSPFMNDPLLTADEVAERLHVSKDWVWDHSSRKTPHLPVIRMGDGTLRYRASRIEDFISERERISAIRAGRR
jgi:predicted DNA-binding transcriptional regulator AlpA